MTNKKTIIFGIIALSVLGGVVWFAGQSDLPMTGQVASILGDNSSKEESLQPAEEEFALGSPKAPVTIVEYSSHLCGHCANFHLQTLPLIMEKYIKTGQVRLIPRRLSPSELGQALLCAQEQGKFQQVDEYLFKNSQKLIQETKKVSSADEIKGVVADWLKAMAGNLDLNQDSFNQCFDSGRYQERVLNWFNQAKEAKITGTPTFLINDQPIIGSQPYSQFEKIIEQELNQ